MERRAVVAIGGNALILEGQRGTIDEQYENARETARHIATLVAGGWGVVVTHGNGPQVGFILLRSELVPKDAPIPKLSLEMSVANSQGGIGHILSQALLNELAARGLPDRVVCVLTHVVVDPDDPAFRAPTKPIGPFYSREQADDRTAQDGWTMIEDFRPRLPPGCRIARTCADRRERPDPHPRGRWLRRDRRGRRRRRRRRDGAGSVSRRRGRHRQGPRVRPPRRQPGRSPPRPVDRRRTGRRPLPPAGRALARPDHDKRGRGLPRGRRVPEGLDGPEGRGGDPIPGSRGQEVLITTPASLERAIAGRPGRGSSRTTGAHQPHEGGPEDDQRQGRAVRVRVRSRSAPRWS